MEKPNDAHTLMAKKISSIISKEFSRTPAKSVKYGATWSYREEGGLRLLESHCM